MKKINYSKDVDAILIELSDMPVDYAEDFGQVIMHNSSSGEPVLLEIFDAKKFSFNLLNSILNEKEVVFA